jgi:FkbM family methyltransferase
MHEYVTTTLSGTFLEGPARRVYATGRALIPGGLLPPAAIKARDYDRMTLRIARIALAGGGSAIDIGAHEGDILRRLARMSPGPHWAFEPIPAFAERLRRRFPSVAVEQAALADYSGEAEFRFMPGAAAYSSLIVRPEVEDGHAVRRLAVRVRRLDDCVPQDARVAFMKIDVEGAEAAVLRGARDLLRRCQPVTVFECGSANLPRCVAALEGTGLEVSFLADYLLGVRHHAAEVMQVGRERGEYYYVAFPVS